MLPVLETDRQKFSYWSIRCTDDNMWSWHLLREKGTIVGCTIAVGSATVAILKELSPRV